MIARHSRFQRVILRAALLVTSVVVVVAVCEFFARLAEPSKHYVWPPNMEKVFLPAPEHMPGIFGPSRFSINSDGIRGDELPSQSTLNILCIGGSTTECLYLDQSETWPHLVQVQLQEKLRPQQQVWIGNIGMAGRRTREHLLQMQKLLPELDRVDAVILLVGCNDIMRRLAEDDKYEPDILTSQQGEDAVLDRAFAQRPRSSSLWPPQKAALSRYLRAAKNLVQSKLHIEDEIGEVYQIRRARRASSTQIRNELPNMSSGLAEYSRNLSGIAQCAETRGVRLILMTQPSLYRDDLTAQEISTLWMGGIGPLSAEPGQGYYSVEALEEAFRMYNQALRTFCEEESIELIDLEAVIPKSTAVFYDDVHFTEHGAAEVASVVAEYLLSASPPGNPVQ
jgi:lysophospholipase L1-like esterase